MAAGPSLDPCPPTRDRRSNPGRRVRTGYSPCRAGPGGMPAGCVMTAVSTCWSIDEDAVLVVGETGDVKKGAHTVGVRNRFCGRSRSDRTAL